MAKMADPYKILGVPRDASAEQIKRAYHKLAKQLHPDLHPDDKTVEERFKQVSAANALLSDPELRGRYDRGEIDASGQERRQRGFQRAHAGAGARQGGFGGGINLDDLFADLFAAGAAPRRSRARGQDIHFDLKVEFLDAARGTTRRLALPDGRSIDVTIPEGITDGQTIRLKGQGMPGLAGGDAGDAYIKIQVAPHPGFTRDGDDVQVTLPVDLDRAVLGGKIEVPTLHGTVSMTIPKGSNSGDTLRLRGKGIKRKDGGHGDQYVKLVLRLPGEPDKDLLALLANWARSRNRGK